MSHPLRLATLLAVLGFPGSGVAQPRTGSTEWPVTTPAAAGINRRTLDSLDAEIARGDYGNVDRMLVIRRGKIAFDKSYRHDYATIYADSAKTKNALNAGDPTGPYNYFNPWWHPFYRRGTLHTLQSVT